MKLTKEKAIELFRELWRWCGETGKPKKLWPRWEFNGGDVPEMRNDCPLCEYTIRTEKKDCPDCPIRWGKNKFNSCLGGLYGKWLDALREDSEKRKRIAKQISELPER